jgi:F420-0:gamma-glutamyl ligase
MRLIPPAERNVMVVPSVLPVCVKQELNLPSLLPWDVLILAETVISMPENNVMVEHNVLLVPATLAMNLPLLAL